MEDYVFVALVAWLLVLISEDIIMCYYAKKCGYNCADCKNWQCRKKTCSYKKEKNS